MEDDVEFFAFQNGRAQSPLGVPSFTIQRQGRVSFNQAAYGAMGEPEAVLIGFSRARNTLVFRKAALTDPNAIPVRKQPNSRTYLVSARRILEHFGISTDPARR